jgi:hypothetical protein
MAERKHHVVLSRLPADISVQAVQKLVDENTSIALGWIIEDDKNPRVVLELNDATSGGATAVADYFDGYFWKGQKIRAAIVLMGEDEYL